MGARPITIVPLIVVALRMSVPATIGKLPSKANTTMVSEQMVMAFGDGRRPAKFGKSLATSFDNEVNVESRVEPALDTITTSIAKNPAKPRPRATSAGTLLVIVMPSSLA